MIFDKIENFGRYKIDFEEMLEVINKEYTKGKFEINGISRFGIGLEYDTKESHEGLWEAHRKYLDIHYILEGEEKVFISNIENMTPTNEYQDDYQLFDGNREQEIILKAGNFLVLFPNEVHKTGVMVNETSSVKKIVFKLLL